MNRDEKRTRVRGLPPEVISVGRHRAILPREPDGGTWIAVNDTGICLALINWHQVNRRPRGEMISRGIVLESVLMCGSLEEVDRRLKRLPLTSLRPFRVLAADTRRRELTEWQWDLRCLNRHNHEWRVTHWFSSGFDEREAERVRAQVCGRDGEAASIAELRKLHRSHAPKRGPFSICMHRKNAATVSYAEVTVTPKRAAMSYGDGPPCVAPPLITRAISL